MATVAEQRILIVDSSETFATMLQQELESCGPYQTVIVGSGTEALDVVARDQIDLAIIDMGLEDMDGPTLVQSLRQAKPELSIVLIPLFGQQIEDKALAQTVQGILPKPFFIGDLPVLIRRALGGEPEPATAPASPVQEAVPPPPASPVQEAVPPPPAAPIEAPIVTFSASYATQDIDTLLQKLFETIRAQAVVFVQGSELIAYAGNVTRERAEKFSSLVAQSTGMVHDIAAFLGETDNRFEQCTFEGDEFSVYSTNITPDAILSVAISARTPVGIVRYNLRRASEALMEIWQQ
jgi:CheY-like chemotaxis protein